ncbi:MAG: hypothetical protein ACLTCI_10850 [[Clostridium] nexile]
MRVRDLCVQDDWGKPWLKGQFDIQERFFGVAGIEGNGQREIRSCYRPDKTL